MTDFSVTGRFSEQPAALPKTQKAPASGLSFGAALNKLCMEVNDHRAAETPETLAGQCLAALDRLEAGVDTEASRALLRRAYREMAEGTEAEYGHLPHDDLTRIMAMYSYARNKQADQI